MSAHSQLYITQKINIIMYSAEEQQLFEKVDKIYNSDKLWYIKRWKSALFAVQLASKYHLIFQ